MAWAAQIRVNISHTLFSMLLLLGACDAIAAAVAVARISEGPHFVAVPFQLQIAAEGFEQRPQPEVEITPQPGVSMTLVGAAPSVRTSVEIINGQVRRSHQVRFVLRYHVVVQQLGNIKLGPFKLTQSGQTASADAITVDVQNVPTSAAYRLEYELPERSWWVGERVPVKFELWVPESRINQTSISAVEVPLFTSTDTFHIGELALDNADRTLSISNASGRTEYPASRRRVQHADGAYIVLTIGRTLTPLRAGEVSIAPARVVVEEVVEWQRNLFGARVPMRTRRVQTQSKSLTIDTQTPPTKGRPASFAGVVGRGFALKVTAERSIVNVGDPITLTVEVRGDGALDTLALPRFSDLGLASQHFQIPNAAVAGTYTDNGAKRFTFNIRALHEDVREVPALELAWFDPHKSVYDTAKSQALALSVRPAKIVGAGDVVVKAASEKSSDPPLAQTNQKAQSTRPTALGETSAANAKQAQYAAADQFTDLAIEADSARLNASYPSGQANLTLLLCAYGAGVLVMLIGWWWRARSKRDPALVQRMHLLRTQASAIKSAHESADIARATRVIVAADGELLERTRVDRLLAKCDTFSFGQQRASNSEMDELRDEALALLRLAESNNLASPRQ
jgi:hypothetical protein